ncbi:hypothetical protein ACTQ4E_00170 [Lawsonibacter sp. LCP25S3_G6]|uniref:hypothetical protein n=1 Tax=unclassified Lawsonibacter TaxID=2617946 RepID=UPI003F9986A7
MGPRFERGGAISAVNSTGVTRRISAGRIYSARGRKRKGAPARLAGWGDTTTLWTFIRYFAATVAAKGKLAGGIYAGTVERGRF